jgi:branched-chain amino acid transport system substrate-binding protein
MKESIKIGFTISLSGPGAGAGTEQYRAYEAWREWVNNRGGIYVKEYDSKLPVEFVYYDDATEPARAKSLYEKLILEDKVDLLLAPWGTFIHLAIVPVIEKYKIPVIGNTAGVEQSKINELQTTYEFFTYPTPKTSAMVYTLFLERLGVKKVALLYAQTDFTVANAKWNKKFLEDKGFADVVVYEGYPLGTTDLKGLLLKVKEANPDAVVVHSYPADAILVTSQMKELDINPKVFVLGVGGQILAFDQKFDDKTKEGIVALNTWHPDFYPEASELYSTYIKKYGHNPPSHALGLAWVSCITLQKAIEKAGTLDPVKIRDVLATETFETPFGEVKFEKQVNTKALTVFDQWQDGELKPIFVFKGVYPNVELAEEFKTVKMEYPKPSWQK